jgi:hypothetical protein
MTDLAYKEKEKICRAATKNFLYTRWQQYSEGIEWDKKADDKALLGKIARCARFLASLRGVVNVWTDDFSGEFKWNAPTIEKPDRINQHFYNLARGHAVVCGRTQIAQEDLRPVVALALDSAPPIRVRLIRALLAHGGTMHTAEVESEMVCTKPTALAKMKELALLGICEYHEGEEHEIALRPEFEWFLSDEFRGLRGDSPIKGI